MLIGGGGRDMENQNRANYVKLVAYTRRDMETKFHPPPPPPLLLPPPPKWIIAK